MAELHDPQNLDNTEMKNMHLQDGESHAGLYTAYQTARQILLDPSILQTLCSTFDISSNAASNTNLDEFSEKVRQIIKIGFHLYVCDWEDTNTCAFYVLPKQNNRFDLENIFIPKREVDILPTNGSHNHWDSSEKLQIIYLIWYLVHEMSHAIGTILHTNGVIKTRQTPMAYSAYNLTRYTSGFIGEDGLEYACGERGFYMESHIGGIMSAINQVGDETKIEYLLLEIRGKRHRVDEDQWSIFYQKNVVKTGPFQPLQGQVVPTIEEEIPTQRLKGRTWRSNLKSSSRTLRNGIFIR
jgi:hypothetical protein